MHWRVLEPVALAQAVDHAPLEVADVAGHALDFRVLDGLDHDFVARPVVGETADLLGRRGYGGQNARDDGRPEVRIGWTSFSRSD